MATADRKQIQFWVKQAILDFMDDGCSPQDIIEAFEAELERFENLVFDYE
jgi:hypothetical protein